MNGDRPGKSPKPPLKAPKVDKQLGRLASIGEEGPREGRLHSLHMCTHTLVRACTHTPTCMHTRTRMHMYARTHTQYTTHAHTHTYVHAHKQTRA